jgi:hypothetical protein
MFAAKLVFGGQYQKTVSSFKCELREAGLLYLGVAYEENETVTLTWNIHPVLTFYLRKNFHHLKIEERDQYHQAFVDYHEWRTWLPPFSTADHYEPLTSSLRLSQPESPFALRPQNRVNLENEISAGTLNFLPALHIGIQRATCGVKYSLTTRKVPLHILHAIHKFDSGLILLDFYKIVNSIAHYTSWAMEAFLEHRSDGHIICLMERLSYGIFDHESERVSQADVLKSLIHYSEWLCRSHLLRDPSN